MGRRRSSAPDSRFLSVWTAYDAICAGNHAGIEHEDDHEQHDFPTHEGLPSPREFTKDGTAEWPGSPTMVTRVAFSQRKSPRSSGP